MQPEPNQTRQAKHELTQAKPRQAKVITSRAIPRLEECQTKRSESKSRHASMYAAGWKDASKKPVPRRPQFDSLAHAQPHT